MLEWGVPITLSIICVIMYLWARHERGCYNNLVMSWQEEKKLRQEETEARMAAERGLSALHNGLAKNERLLVAQARVHDHLVKEKDELWAQYQTTVSQLANGQSLLSQQVRHLLRAYNGYRKQHGDEPVKLDPFIEQVLDKEE